MEQSVYQMKSSYRKIIHSLIKKSFKQKDKNEVRFEPGKSFINYAGRVFDEKEVINAVDASLDFWLTTGRFARLFEKKLSSFINVSYCSLVNSGSSANLLAISALTSPLLKKRQLFPGDEVITTACGFPTTLNAIIQNRLTPVFVDIELGTYNIKVEKIKRAISKRTKAIFVAHTLGNPVDLDALRKICKLNNLWLVEDNCDALGAKYRSRMTGSFGDISTCSFYPPHHITTGEGGAVLTDNKLLKRIIDSFRDWGRDCWCETGYDNTCKGRFDTQFGKLPRGYDHKYVYSHIGYNLKMTDIQAAIGVAQLNKLINFVKIRNNNFRFLFDHLKEYSDYFLLPQPTKNSTPSWFGFPLLVKKDVPFTRDEIVRYLEKEKVQTRMLFGGNLTKQPAYLGTKYRIAGELRNSDAVMNNLFWIGVYPGLTKNKRSYVLRAIKQFIGSL